MSKIRFLLKYISKHKLSYFGGLIFVILTNWIAVTIPEYLKNSIDLIQSQKLHDPSVFKQLINYFIFMILLAILMIIVRLLSRILFFNPGRAIEYQIKNDIFYKLTLLSKEYYDKNSAGSIISRIQNDITGVRVICGFGMLQLFNITTALSLTPYKMWQLSPKLTLYCIIPIVFVFLLIRIGMYYIVSNSKKRMTLLQDLSGFIVSSLSGIDVIKQFNVKSWVFSKFNKTNIELTQKSLNISLARSFLMAVLQNIDNILKILIFGFGGILVFEQQFTIGELTAFIIYAGLLTLPLTGLGWLTTMFQQGLVGLASIKTILEQKEHKSNLNVLPETVSNQLFNKGIHFQNLTYKYPNTEVEILRNINLTIMPHQKIGILGKVGSGKTTLVNCLNGYLKIPDKNILFGDVDINKLHNSDIGKVVKTVTQDIFLFSDTIKENILFGLSGSKTMSNNEIDKVIYQSALKGEIDHFPQKTETLVGEKGIMLSGGQKQRISFARAIANPCQLLILDNVLSAVDHETERFLLDQIFNNNFAQSLLMISHRVQALEKCDKIYVLENGEIVNSGTHRELITKPGLYSKTWALQNEN